MNEPGQFTSPVMYTGKPCSWIRDTLALNVKAAWSATYRDAIILNPLNGKLIVYNLTVNNLQLPENRATMKSMLISAASVVDADSDRIPDYWEEWALGRTTAGALDAMPDGGTLLESYALCANPGAGRSAGVFLVPDGGSVVLRYARRRGTGFGVTVTPQFSADLVTWDAGPDFGAPVVSPLYNGSGGELVEWRTSAVSSAARFVRLVVDGR